MDAILATSKNNVIYQRKLYANPTTSPTYNNEIPWHTNNSYAIDKILFSRFTKNRVLWVTIGTYLSLPWSVQSDPNRSFKLLGKRACGLVLNGAFEPPGLKPSIMPVYTFDDLNACIDNLDSNHVLIGGPKAYKKFLPKCQTVLWGTPQINYYHPSNFYFEDSLDFVWSPCIYNSKNYKLACYTNHRKRIKEIKRQLGIA
jgi:hypothetical protein